MIAYKFTGRDAVGMFSQFTWPVPDGTNPGAWVGASGPARICTLGVHACRVGDVPYWLGPELWEIELAGDVVEGDHKLVAPRGRLLRRVEGWPGSERPFAEDCAARTQDLAVAALREAGLATLAAVAAEASAVEELAAVAARAEAIAPPLVARLAGYAVDCVWDIDKGYYSMCAYVAATASANHSTGTMIQDLTSVGWIDERQRQARWLVERLALRDVPYA